MTTSLELHDVAKVFGGLKAVDGVSFSLLKGHVTALIGPNGAGKSTIINLITGVFPPSRGRIELGGADITHLPMHQRARMGVARTYQTPQMIQGLNALENVMAGAYRFGAHGLLTTVFAPWVVAKENAAMSARAAAALHTAGVPDNWWERRATDLPYGIQRRVEIARALAQEPLVLLLDEPAAGLNPAETYDVGQLLKTIASSGISVLLVEHDMPMVMSIADHVVVVNFGSRLAMGTPAAVAADPVVIAAYLGTDDEDVPERELA